MEKRLCVNASARKKSFVVQNCVNASVCKSFCVSKLLTSRSRSTRRSRRRSRRRGGSSCGRGRGSRSEGGEGGDSNQTRQRCAGREQRNKYKPRTGTSTKQEQTEEQHLTIRHAGGPADYKTIYYETTYKDIQRTYEIHMRRKG